jgi:hypothetical protein
MDLNEQNNDDLDERLDERLDENAGFTSFPRTVQVRHFQEDLQLSLSPSLLRRRNEGVRRP